MSYVRLVLAPPTPRRNSSLAYGLPSGHRPLTARGTDPPTAPPATILEMALRGGWLAARSRARLSSDWLSAWAFVAASDVHRLTRAVPVHGGVEVRLESTMFFTPSSEPGCSWSRNETSDQGPPLATGRPRILDGCHGGRARLPNLASLRSFVAGGSVLRLFRIASSGQRCAGQGELERESRR